MDSLSLVDYNLLNFRSFINGWMFNSDFSLPLFSGTIFKLTIYFSMTVSTCCYSVRLCAAICSAENYLIKIIDTYFFFPYSLPNLMVMLKLFTWHSPDTIKQRILTLKILICNCFPFPIHIFAIIFSRNIFGQTLSLNVCSKLLYF